jgi:hypothetical protein
MRGGHHETEHYAENRHRPFRQRHAPFSAVLAAAWLGVPALGGLFALTGWADDRWGHYGLRSLIIILVMFLAPGLSAVALTVGWKVTRRPVSLVYAHVALTIFLLGLALAIFTAVGFQPVWLTIYMVTSLGMAGSWMLYRIDALRSDPREKGDRGDSWADMLGLAKSRPVLAKAEVTSDRIEVPVQIGKGETLKQVVDALPKLEEAAGAVRGRGRVVGGTHGGSATMTIMLTDPLKTWKHWPGLSRPGGSIADPIRTAYYDTGADQWYFIGPDPTIVDGAPRRPRGSSIGRAGITGSGKSGDAGIELAEVLSRRDAVALYIDISKLIQNAGWAIDMLTLAADTTPKAQALFRAVRRMARDRVLRLGEYDYRDWTPAAFDDPRLRMPAVYLFIDEADEVLAALAEWIATKALSTGIYLSVALPKADTKSIPSNVRSAIGQWKAFGAGPGYGPDAILTPQTLEAANADELLHQWGGTIPGAHLLDSAIGIDRELFPISARAYAASHAELRTAVCAARAQFEPAQLCATDIAALGTAYAMCAAQNVRTSQTADAQAADAKLTAQDIDDQETEDGDEMPETAEELDTRIPVRKIQADDDAEAAEDKREYAETDPRTIAPKPTNSVSYAPDVPRGTDTEAIAEFDRVVRKFAENGRFEFGNKDLLDECKLWSASAMSRRLSSVADPDDDAEIQPPGIKLQRIKRGTYHILFDQTAATE